jgi:hypothetical protein
VEWAWFSTIAAVTAGLAAMAVRRGVGGHVRVLVAHVRRGWAPLTAGALVVAGSTAVRLLFRSVSNFNAPVAFRYWSDGIEIADAHRLPHLTLQWGRLFPPASSKILLNAFNGAASFLLGRDPLRALGPLLFLGSVGLVIALWAVGRELGLGVFAALFPVLLVANRLALNPEMTRDMDTYRAEAFGRMVAFVGLAVAIAAVRDRSGGRRRLAVMAAALFAVAGATHLVPMAVVAAILVWFAVARVAAGGGWVPVRTVAVVLGLGGILALGVLVLPRGDVGFQGVTASSGYQRFGRSFDPTTFLLTGKRSSALAAGRGGHAYSSPGVIAERFFTDGLHARLPLTVDAALAAVALCVALAILRWFPAPIRPLGLTAWGTGATLLAVAVLFGRGFHVMILAEFGRRRLSDYTSLPWILLVLGVLEGVVASAGRRRPQTVALAAGLAVVAAAPFVWSARPPSGSAERAARAVPVVAMVRRSTACDARILVNRRTIATLESTSGRAGLVEGMAPYLRPDMLVRAVGAIEGAERFFHDPAGTRALLASEDVGYVLYVRRSVPFGPLAGPIDGSPSALDGAPFLRLVASTSSARLYRVLDTAPVPRPAPAGRPGYRCVRADEP